MDIIKRIVEHTAKDTNINYENEISCVGQCVSLKTKKVIGDSTTYKVLKEYHLDDLRKEYQKICSDKQSIENLFNEWEVVI